MNGRGKSDSSVVPGKRPNKAGEPVAEVVEGRGLAKGNSTERNTFRTQRREDVQNALGRVRQAAKREKKQRFTALLHHVYGADCLRRAYLVEPIRQKCGFPIAVSAIASCCQSEQNQALRQE
jgi:RNA-directed DNA polymerase